MIKECLEVFSEFAGPQEDRLVIESGIPADGTYVLVGREHEKYEVKDIFDIKNDKKSRKIIGKSNIHYEDICFYDYYSRLLEMNKPVDPKKTIHSNNYLSFFIKKDNLANKKLTEETIEQYYHILEEPELKYKKSKKALELYGECEKQLGPVDLKKLSEIREWIKENIFKLDVDLSGKDYLKIFFEAPKEEYIREGNRYIMPNIYNSNDYNHRFGGEIYGLPNDNLGMNAKKPYLEHKTRGQILPYMISNQEVLKQKRFFDYLLNLSAFGKYNVYMDRERKKITALENGSLPSGTMKNAIFLRIHKDKNEAGIDDYQIIPDYSPKLKTEVDFKNILELDLASKNVSVQKYGLCRSREKMQDVINEVFFNKYLINNYFTPPHELSITDDSLKYNLLLARERLFQWFYICEEYGVFEVLEKVSLNLVKGSIQENHLIKASHQFNLRWSLINSYRGGKEMDIIYQEIKEKLRGKLRAKETGYIESDSEYYFAVGQAVAFLLFKSKANKKMMSFVNPFINGKKDKVIKEKMSALFKKYNYDMEAGDRRVANLFAMIMGYVPEEDVNQDYIIMGFLNNNLIFEKKKEEKQDE